MLIFIPREIHPGETRVPIVPDTVQRLVDKGVTIEVESCVGLPAGHCDNAYEKAGAQVVTGRTDALARADMVLRLRKPPEGEVRLMQRGAVHISFLDPFHDAGLIHAMADAGVTGISMEMIPRTTLAQKMDALSSQANLAGYVAVILAAERLDKILPMMMTPAGTIAPSRVFVIGAGVAGLQAIATARRLGARVEAFDTRPAVEEQVTSLGARFVKADLGETGETEGGYARELTPEQQEKQREAMAKVCAQADVVITTAQVFGKKAPLIITDAMVQSMRPGSVIVDLAVDSGGNTEGVVEDEEIVRHGVTIIGRTNLPGLVPVHASQMYSANVGNLVEAYWDSEAGRFAVDLEDEILAGCVVVHDGAVVNDSIQECCASV